MVNHVNRIVELRVTTAMKVWWEENIPSSIEFQVELLLESTGERYGNLRDGPYVPIPSPTAHEEEFFGMVAPLALIPSRRIPRDATTMRWAEVLKRHAISHPVDGLNSTMQSELASKITIDTKATRELSLEMAAQLLAGRSGDGYYGCVGNVIIAMDQRVHRRRIGALLQYRLIPQWTPEQYLELSLHFLDHGV